MFYQGRQRLRRLLTAPIFEGQEEKTQAASMLNTIVLTTLTLSVVFSIATPFISPNPKFSLIFTGILALPQLAALALMHRGHVQSASILLSSLFWGIITLSAVIAGGVRSTSYGIYILVILTAGLLLGLRAAVIFIALSFLSGLGMLYAEAKGILPQPFIDNTSVSIWTVQIVSFGAATALLSLATRRIHQALENARRYATELEDQREHLEEMITQRTRGLARRARYLETTAEVARDAATVLDLQTLLSRTATLVSERFGFYHTGVFLLDPTGEWAVLQAASSEGGQRMLARGHRLRVGQEGIVGYVTDKGEPRVALDVGADAVFFNNPDLPDTRSEMALPLQARGEIIGALDVQSTEPAAFSEEDVTVLQTLADQVAVAISNARLLRQVEESLEAERKAYGELSHEGWRELLRAQSDIGFIKSKHGISRADDLWRPHMKTALRSGEIARDNQDGKALAMPIKARDHVIGVIDVHKPDGEEAWTSGEIALLETLADQLGIALESARLHQDTQRRAARERVASEITTRMRESLDIETILKTTVQEVRQALDLPEVVVRLKPQGADEQRRRTSSGENVDIADNADIGRASADVDRASVPDRPQSASASAASHASSYTESKPQAGGNHA
jgi:GAF domain-containing protein